MRKNCMFIVLLVCLLLIGGCGKVVMSPDYSKLVRQANLDVAELNSRCQGGDEDACREGLAKSSATLHLIVTGLDIK